MVVIDDIPGTHCPPSKNTDQYGYWRYFGKSESAVNVFNAAQGQNWVMEIAVVKTLWKARGSVQRYQKYHNGNNLKRVTGENKHEMKFDIERKGEKVHYTTLKRSIMGPPAAP